MDVNGTHFHLVLSDDDWRRLVDVADLDDPGHPPPARRVAWDAECEALTLAPQLFHFVPPGKAAGRIDPGSRLAATSDRYGAVYWIERDPSSGIASRIYRLRPGHRHGELFWDTSALDPAPSLAGTGDFSPVATVSPPAVSLSGLTVTGHHYLVAGNAPGHELLVFDLHAGGAPVHLGWPAAVPFDPWDIEAAPLDGFWVLDRTNKSLWHVDRGFGVLPFDPAQLSVIASADPGDFKPFPVGSAGPVGGTPARSFPLPFVIPGAVNPISIAGLPDGSLLLLDELADASASVITQYRDAQPVFSYNLANVVPASDSSNHPYSILAYDLVYLPDARKPKDAGTLYLVDAEGNQAFRFTVAWKNTPPITLDTVYLPMQSYAGGELVTRDRDALYDFSDRWIALRPVDRPRYEEKANLESGLFDAHEVNCVWHRILLDALIPQETSVAVFVRAADTELELQRAVWLRQPVPYLRRDGSELPFYRPRGGGAEPFNGTWEALLQDVRGRYLNVRLELRGTGRATPALSAMRVHYPRFSYLDRYLPKLYRDDVTSASFTDRVLADFEGLFTTWEGRIVDISRYFDPRAVPAEALDWLASWVSIAFDPFWSEARRRLFLAHIMDLYRWRGTARGLEMALRLYLDPEPTEAIFSLTCVPRGVRPTVRFIELFRTRESGGAVQGLFTAGDSGDQVAPLTVDRAFAAAHRFVVLVPEGLAREQVAAVRRIVELNKPAHTAFDVQLYWALFRVGAARLEIETDLGCGSRFHRTLLGESPLGAGSHLAYPHPLDVTEREVADRDRYGFAPPL